eukprot:1720795-Pyramimonas_sp.AAC.1
MPTDVRRGGVVPHPRTQHAHAPSPHVRAGGGSGVLPRARGTADARGGGGSEPATRTALLQEHVPLQASGGDGGRDGGPPHLARVRK